MKKVLTLIVICFTVINALGQLPINLVPNPSFEIGVGNTNNIPHPSCNPYLYFDLYRYIRLENWTIHDAGYTQIGIGGTPEWHSFQTTTSPYSMCVVCYPLNIENTTFENPFIDDKYVVLGVDYENPYGEYIQTELYEALQVGKKYKIRVISQSQLTALPSNFINSVLQVHLTTVTADWHHTQNIVNNQMSCMWCSFDTYECKPRSFEHVITASKENLKQIVLQANQSFSYVDRVELYEYCTEYLVRQGRIYKYDTEIEEAGNIIAGSVVNNTTLGDVTMLGGSITKYKASTEVNLKEGFNVERGADFHAKIAECGSECSSTSFDLPSFYELCNNNCIQVGPLAAKYGLSYTWNSSIPTNLNYLSNLNIANPVFCIPPGVYGSFTFELTVTNSCGEQTKRTVTIEIPENTTPGFSILQNNLSSKPIYPEISILPVLNTEKIIVDIMDCNGNILYTKTYTDGIDFYSNNSQTIQPIKWTLNEFLTPCDCYKIRIRSKNYCNENYKEEILSWDRPKTPVNLQLPTLARCINGQLYFCFGGDGFSAMKLELFNRWGVSVLSGQFTFSSSPFCIPISGGDQLPSGTYALTVDVIDCYGRVTKHNTTIFIPSCGDGLIGDDKQGDGVTLNKSVKYIKPDGSIDSVYTNIYPNPINETTKIQFYLPVKSKVKLTILNSNFESKCFVINSSELSEGMHEYSIPEGCFLTHGVNYYMLETIDIENIKIIQRFSVN